MVTPPLLPMPPELQQGIFINPPASKNSPPHSHLCSEACPFPFPNLPSPTPPVAATVPAHLEVEGDSGATPAHSAVAGLCVEWGEGGWAQPGIVVAADGFSLLVWSHPKVFPTSWNWAEMALELHMTPGTVAGREGGKRDFMCFWGWEGGTFTCFGALNGSCGFCLEVQIKYKKKISAALHLERFESHIYVM